MKLKPNKYLIFGLTIFTLLSSQWAQGEMSQICGRMMDLSKIRPELQQYEVIRSLTLKPTLDINQFSPMQGIFVTKRDAQNNPVEGFIRVLSDNPNQTIQVTGDFNNWSQDGRVTLHPDTDPRYLVGTFPHLSHGMQYRLVVNGQELIDPAALVQATPDFNQKMYGKSDPFLNSVFWDVEGAGKYVAKNPRVDLRAKAMSISENDIMSLAQNWKFNGQTGPSTRSETYNFIANSGIIGKLKDWGINSIEFLPLTASVDGDVWAYRYLNFAPAAIDSRWGTPADFSRMVDAFNGAGIAVILDVVPGHFTQHGNQGVRDIAPIGIHNQKKGDGQGLYGSTLSEWGTLRYDYLNPYVRRFLIDSIINFIKYYGISGIRTDNYNGIQSLPGGPQFLRELNGAVKAYAPDIYINAETFGGDSYVTKRMDQDGHGNSSHNSGDFFGFIFEFAQKRTEDIDMNVVRGLLRNPWGWYESAALKYITNHDEAANSRGQASGAYFATLVNGGGWNYVEGKVRAFAGLAMFSGSFYLDMPQLRILQEGTFYTNTAIQWDNLQYDSQNRMSEFFAEASRYYTTHAAFAFDNTHPDIENSTDYDNKITTLKRIDMQTGKVIYIVVNLGDRSFANYQFGISEAGNFRVALDSDNPKFGGSGRLGSQVANGINADATGIQGKSHAITLPFLAPYSVTILEN